MCSCARAKKGSMARESPRGASYKVRQHSEGRACGTPRSGAHLVGRLVSKPKLVGRLAIGNLVVPEPVTDSSQSALHNQVSKTRVGWSRVCL